MSYAARPVITIDGQDKILVHVYLYCGCRVDMAVDPSYAEGKVDDYRADLWVYGKYLDRHPYTPDFYKRAEAMHAHQH